MTFPRKAVFGLLLYFVFTSALYAQSTQTSNPMGWAYTYLLVTENDADVINGVKDAVSIERNYLSEQFFDLAADVFSERLIANDLNNRAKESFLWILVYSGNAKYYDFMLEAGRNVSSKEINPILKRIKNSQKETKAIQYHPNNNRRKQVIDDYVRQSRNAKTPESSSSSIHAIKLGMAPSNVLKILGQYQSSEFRTTNGLRTTWFYKGQGAVVFQKDISKKKSKKKQDSPWRVDKIVADPYAYEHEMPYLKLTNANKDYSGDSYAYTVILHGSLRSIEHLIAKKLYVYADTLSTDMLDILAELMVQNYNGQDDRTSVSAYAWICKLLVYKDYERYTLVLDEIRKRTRSSDFNKILKYSKPAKSRNPRKLDHQLFYQPGTLNLAELRVTYPPIYKILLDDKETHDRKIKVLLYSDIELWKDMLKQIDNDLRPVSPLLLDIVSEQLNRGYKKAVKEDIVDAYSWASKLLSNKNYFRYSVLLEEVNKNSKSIKLQRYSAADGRVAPTNTNFYKPGSLDLERLKNEYPNS